MKWTRITAKTYQCAADYGPIDQGDQVLATHATAIELAWRRTGTPSMKTVVSTAMSGIIRFYPTSCYRDLAETWLEDEVINSNLVRDCF
jgi:hypothetical protein